MEGKPGPRWVLRRKKGIAWREVEGEVVLVNVRGNEVIQLNPQASFIWTRLDGEKTLESIALDMTGSYDVQPSTALEDVLEFARLLVEREVVEIAALD